MTWNYRIMRSVGGRGTTKFYTYGIHEVYYDGRKLSWTEGPVEVTGETFDDLKDAFDLMRLAFKKPILDSKTGKPV